ncbi:DivIVA domain-containing protein [Gallibacter intestinalis]|uniref:DivIVA domain-containing protein n=1 Tax=Gallibacter intestinalis TaxID=2779356 RepID=A0ABR9QVN8_9FIRM|nr:DivIVA domain-containing protein [Gallibacter intestinalis]MBE5034933.1 DivIVA domain-containing protein [Gallibacter intestinalis]
MITPADIQNKEFTKGFRGYDEEEVDMFLDLITLDLEKLMKENLNLKAQIATLKKDQDSIGGSDLTVKETLETAKRIMDDLAVSSEKRAKVLVENAEMDAAIIIKDAKMKAEQVAAESSQLTRSYEEFKREYKNLLTKHLEEFESISANIDIDGLNSLIEESKNAKSDVDATSELEKTIIRDSQDSDDDDRKTVVNIKYE